MPKPVRGSKTGRPIMVLLDLLGRRMSLRVLWELSIAEAPLSFRALQAAADTNPGVLNTRLKELREAKLVALDEDGYSLTKTGLSLLGHVRPLSDWSRKWAAQLDASEIP